MDTLKDFKYTMDSCNRCGQCKWILGPKMRGYNFAEICPIHSRYNYDAYSGQGLINIAREVLEGKLKYEKGLIDLIYTCTTCGACDINCKSVRDMEVLDTILALRAKCAESGQLPEQHKKLAQTIEKSHNIYGKPHDRRFEWMPDNFKPSLKSDVAYFAGCNASYIHPEIAQNTVKILTSGGMDFKVMYADEYCCGAPLWRTGQTEAAQKAIEHNLQAFHSRGIKTIVTACAECYGTFKGGYPRFAEMDIEVLHITEVIQHMLKAGKLKLKNKVNMKATYHDPCLLGRLSEKYVPWKGEIKAYGLHEPPKQWRRGTNGVYAAPREILRAIPGMELVEMTRNEENSFCCGAGGGVSSVFPDFAQWTASQRLDEAKSTGAAAIVSCCPFCKSNFETSINSRKDPLRYYDLTELVAEAL